MPGNNDKITADVAEKLKALKDVKLTGVSANFIAENNEKFERWGLNMFFSQKQANWVNNLYDEHVGHGEPEPKELDMNDEIPY